jgi:hypothetical protein
MYDKLLQLIFKLGIDTALKDHIRMARITVYHIFLILKKKTNLTTYLCILLPLLGNGSSETCPRQGIYAQQ